MSLKNVWKIIKDYDGNLEKNKTISNEIELLPFRYSTGKWQSFNSDDKNILTVAEYIRQDKPDCVLECGTFEARSTEYFVRQMRMHNPHQNKKFVTIDVGGCILHMAEDHVTFQKDEGYEESMRIRYNRLANLFKDPFVEVIYREGLTQFLLPGLMKEFDFDFIYEDASHLPHILQKDWEHINKYAKVGCVVCFDDMKGNEFKDWIELNSYDWDSYYSDIERGQIWLERIK